MPFLLQELVAHSTPDNTPCTYKGPPIGYACIYAWHPNPNGTIFSYSNIKTVRPPFAQMCQEEHCWYCETDKFKLPVLCPWPVDVVATERLLRLLFQMPPPPRPHHVQPVPIADPVAPPPASSSSVTPTTSTLTSSASITPAAASSPAASSSSPGTGSSVASGFSFASNTVEPPTTRSTTPVRTPVRNDPPLIYGSGLCGSYTRHSSFTSTTVEPPTTRATTPVRTPVRNNLPLNFGSGRRESYRRNSSFTSTTVEPPTTRATTPVRTPVSTCNLGCFRLIYGQGGCGFAPSSSSS